MEMAWFLTGLSYVAISGQSGISRYPRFSGDYVSALVTTRAKVDFLGTWIIREVKGRQDAWLDGQFRGPGLPHSGVYAV